MDDDILSKVMRAIHTVFACLWTFSAMSQAAMLQNNVLTPEERDSGWMLLFDGKTMNHWMDPSHGSPQGDAWNITNDGCLHALAHPRIIEDLFSDATYRDFELSFEWRISEAGNSGVKYRIQDHKFLVKQIPGEPFEFRVQRTLIEQDVKRESPGQDYVIGFEYQITDNARNKDALTAGPMHSTGALYDMVAPMNAKNNPVGQFNQSRIVVKGLHTEHWLNGVKVVDTMLDSSEAVAGIRKRWGNSPSVEQLLEKEPVKDCPISLQNHGDEAWFRNIKIKRL
jgi:hypothetical protein